jgi:hypothetical protein
MPSYPANSPTPDPDAKVYDFEGEIERACKTVFLKQWFPLYQAAKQRDSEILVTPRASFHLTVGEQDQRDLLIQGTQDPTNGNLPWAYPYVWKGSIRSRIVTNRLNDSDPASTNHQAHYIIRSWLRRLFQCHFRISKIMQYHQIVRAWETGSETMVDDEQKHDLTEMSHGLIFAILPSAFPTKQ